MRKSQNLIIGLLVLILVSTILVSAQAQEVPIKDKYWNQISEKNKFALHTHDYSGSLELAIGGIYFEAASDVLVNEEAKKGFNLVIEQQWGDRKVLMIWIQAFQETYFFPTEFVFVQDMLQYKLGYSDYISLDQAFSGGELKEGVATFGLIAIPESVDISEPYEIYYDDEKTNM